MSPVSTTTTITEKIAKVRENLNAAIKDRNAAQAALDALFAVVPEKDRAAVAMISDGYKADIESAAKKVATYTESLGAYEKAQATMEAIGPLIKAFGEAEIDPSLVTGSNVSLATLNDQIKTVQTVKAKATAQETVLSRLARAKDRAKITDEVAAGFGALTFAAVEGKSAVTLAVSTGTGSRSGGTRAGGRRYTITATPEGWSDLVGKRIGSKEYEYESWMALGKAVHADTRTPTLIDDSKMSSLTTTKEGKTRNVSWRNVMLGLGFAAEPITDSDDQSESGDGSEEPETPEEPETAN